MSIATQLTRIQTAKADIKSAIEAKGVTVPSSALIDEYDTYIAQISGGSDDVLKDFIERDITSINIPSGTTSIGHYVFSNCSGLTSVTIPNSVTSIGDSAFQYCSGLTSVTIPNSVTTIGNYAFYGCTGLTSVTIPNSVTTIYDSVFRDCSSLTSVTIGNSVTSIGDSAFRGCSSLTSVTIPNTVTSIGQRAFQDCSGLTSLTLNATTPPTLANVNAFSNTNNCPIYVPSASVEAYKAAYNWSTYASRIQAIPVQ